MGCQVGNSGVIVEGRQDGGADHQEPFIFDGGQENGNPPSLAAAMNHQSGKEEANQNGALHIDIVLVVAGGLGESDEEEEAEDEDHLVVGGHHGEGEEEKVNDGDPSGDGIFPLDPTEGDVHVPIFLAAHVGEFFFKDREVEDVGEKDPDDGFPTEVQEHVFHPKVPLRSDHEHWRRRKMGEGSAHGDIDKEETEGGVGELIGRVKIKEFLGQQHRGDGHGCRLGDEGSENGGDGQGGEPPGGGGASEELGDLIDHGLGKANDGPGGGDGHNDDHEEGFGEVDVLADVEFELFEASSQAVALYPKEPENGGTEGEHPNSENGFNLTEKVEEIRFE